MVATRCTVLVLDALLISLNAEIQLGRFNARSHDIDIEDLSLISESVIIIFVVENYLPYIFKKIQGQVLI